MRDALLIAVAGRKKIGKSFLTETILRNAAAGNPVKGVPPRRVLIFDVNNEYEGKFKTLKLEEVRLFSVHSTIECRRISPFREIDGKRMTLDELAVTLEYIMDNYINGILLVEDINKYISDTMPNDIIGAICTNRHIGVDVIIHYQSIGRISTKVWQNVNMVRLHKISDTVKRHEKKYPDKIEYLSIAEIIINKKYDEGDIRFFLYADIDDDKIYGKFSDEDMEFAVKKYISLNYNKIINPLLNARDENGKKIYTPQSAMAEVKKRLMNYRK